MTTAPEDRRDRIERMKRKFMRLSKTERIAEFVRHERALLGALPHKFPQEYLEDCVEALGQMMGVDYADNPPRLDRALRLMRTVNSKPFVVPD